MLHQINRCVKCNTLLEEEENPQGHFWSRKEREKWDMNPEGAIVDLFCSQCGYLPTKEEQWVRL